MLKKTLLAILLCSFLVAGNSVAFAEDGGGHGGSGGGGNNSGSGNSGSSSTPKPSPSPSASATAKTEKEKKEDEKKAEVEKKAAEEKKKADDKKAEVEKKKQDKCDNFAKKAAEKADKFANTKDTFIGNLSALSTRGQKLAELLKAKGYDTTKLEADLATYKTKLDAAVVVLNAEQPLIDALKTASCGTDDTTLRTKIKAVKAAHDRFKTALKAARESWKVVRADVAVLKAEQEKKAETENETEHATEASPSPSASPEATSTPSN